MKAEIKNWSKMGLMDQSMAHLKWLETNKSLVKTHRNSYFLSCSILCNFFRLQYKMEAKPYEQSLLKVVNRLYEDGVATVDSDRFLAQQKQLL